MPAPYTKAEMLAFYADNEVNAITEETGRDLIESIPGIVQEAEIIPAPWDDDPSTLSSDTPDPGESPTYARGDHVHEHGALSGGSLHSNANGFGAGFMSAAHFTKLENMPEGPVDAAAVVFDPSGTTLAADDVEEALGELDSNFTGLQASVGDLITAIVALAEGRAFKYVSTDTYTVLDEDYDKRLVFTHESGCTVTFPSGLTSPRSFQMFSTVGAITLATSGGMDLQANALFDNGVAAIASDGAIAPIEVLILTGFAGYVFGQMAVVV